MEGEGPRILRGRRRETAAEQMTRQQREFEDRSGPVRDEAQRAATHNETHPKLKRQLDRRRSVTEQIQASEHSPCNVKNETAASAGVTGDEGQNAPAHNETRLKPKRQRGVKRRSTELDAVGSAAAGAKAQRNGTRPKLKRRLDKRRSDTDIFLDRPVKRMRLCQPVTSRSSYYRRRTRRHADRARRPRNIHRVVKRRVKRPCTCSKCLRKPVCRKNMANFCVYVVNKRIGTDTFTVDPKEPVAILTPKPRSIKGSDHSVGVHTPASRNQSLSSYNSFYSSDHQPMV